MSNKLLLILSFLFIIQLRLYAQFTTPNNGQSYNLNDLVGISSGVVTGSSGQYLISNDLTISANDSLIVNSASILRMATGVEIISLGYLELDGGSQIIEILPDVTGQFFKGFRIENGGNSYLRNVHFKSAGGIRLLNSDLNIEQCVFMQFDKSNSTGALNLFQSSPTVSNCYFIDNEGVAFNSGANVFSAPKIYNCIIQRNNTANTNAPQINLGPSGPGDTIKIVGNTIEGLYDNAGGISTSNLLGTGQQNVVIDSNTIVNNRYGITCTGGNIQAVITRNIILNNNIQNNPNLGGSGINFNGSSSNLAIVGGNYIAGNLWGVTIQGNAQPDLGSGSNSQSGYNCLDSNGNGGVIYELYNNTPDPISAQFNDWHNANPENVVFHSVDDPNLGTVNFTPFETGLSIVSADFSSSINGLQVNFTNLSLGDSLTYNWDFGDGNYSSLENPIHTYANGGIYFVTLTTRGQCTFDQKVDSLSFSICNISIDSTAFDFQIDSNTFNVNYTNNIIGDSLMFYWDFGDGNFSTDPNPSHLYDSSGTYLVSLLSYNSCNDSVSGSDSIFVPAILTDLANSSHKRLKYWPNPVEDILWVDSPNLNTKLILMDLNGREVLNVNLNQGLQTIPLKKIRAGIYLLHITDKFGKMKTHRLFIH